jgi:hypothetical protein
MTENWCRQQCGEAIRAASAQECQQRGHLLNVSVQALNAHITVDGQGGASFRDAVHTVQVCSGALNMLLENMLLEMSWPMTHGYMPYN